MHRDYGSLTSSAGAANQMARQSDSYSIPCASSELKQPCLSEAIKLLIDLRDQSNLLCIDLNESKSRLIGRSPKTPPPNEATPKPDSLLDEMYSILRSIRANLSEASELSAQISRGI